MKKPIRQLVLRSETVRVLTRVELAFAGVGGADTGRDCSGALNLMAEELAAAVVKTAACL
jgi:hypothetical protein